MRARGRQIERHCEKMADEPAKPSGDGARQDRIFTASGIGGEACELADVEGGPAAPA